MLYRIIIIISDNVIRIGRRWSNVGFLFIGGVAGLACSFVQFTQSKLLPCY